jgi:hypothetical protein
MKIYQYANHAEYVAAQIEANVRKINLVWVDRHTIETIAARHVQAHAILCHGTRNATEQRYFLESFPQAEIIGTEISPTADQFPMTTQWDFHEVNVDWIGRMDIVYSNAIDHSYDPVLALRVWAEQLAADGRLYVEHGYGPKDNRARASDPLEIYDSEIREIIQDLGLLLEGTFDTKSTLPRSYCKVYVIKK